MLLTKDVVRCRAVSASAVIGSRPAGVISVMLIEGGGGGGINVESFFDLLTAGASNGSDISRSA